MTLAEIVGHRSLEMIQRVYQKLRKKRDYMRKAVQQAVGVQKHGA